MPGKSSKHSSPLKNSQLLRRCKKFKLLRINKYASTLNFSCSLHLGFLNELPTKDFFNIYGPAPESRTRV